jgi:deazaflavin-dependent oxidoreductase (nitroreductase family)
MQFWKEFTQRSFRFFFTTTDLVTQWVYRFSKGALGHKQAGYNILLLTTVGRKSGKARTHALLYLKVEENWVVVASNGGNPKHPDWYFNLLSQPKATIQVGKYFHDVEASAASDVERSTLWQLLVDVWPAFEKYEAGIQGEIPILLLKPVKPIRNNGVKSFLYRSKNHLNVVKSLLVNNSVKRISMFIPIHRKTFLRDVIVIQAGFALFGFSIAAMIRSNLGTSAWAVLEVALSNIMFLSPGTLSVIVGFVVLLVAISLKEKIGWGTLANILFIGPWEDLFLWVIPSVSKNLIFQYGLLLIGVLAMGIASAIYIGVDAGAGPRDSLMLAVKRKTGLSIRMARVCIELFVVLAGWLLKGPLGVGTLIFAILIGPAVQWGFKLFKVQPHKNLVDSSI